MPPSLKSTAFSERLQAVLQAFWVGGLWITGLVMLPWMKQQGVSHAFYLDAARLLEGTVLLLVAVQLVLRCLGLGIAGIKSTVFGLLIGQAGVALVWLWASHSGVVIHWLESGILLQALIGLLLLLNAGMSSGESPPPK